MTPALAQDQDGEPPNSEAVAILGFTNLGGDPALEWIGPGTVESVRADLSSLGVRVVAAATVQAALAGRDETHSDPDRTASEVGAALDARWVVSGGYQRIGTSLRLTARLYDTTSDGEASVIRSEGLREDLFDLQGQIAEQLGARIRPGSRVSDRAVSVLPSTSGFRAPAAGIDAHPLRSHRP